MPVMIQLEVELQVRVTGSRTVTHQQAGKYLLRSRIAGIIIMSIIPGRVTAGRHDHDSNSEVPT